MPVNPQVDEAFAKALDHVKAHVSPKDGGVTAAAVEALRAAWNSNPDMQAAVAQQVDAAKVEAEKVNAQVAKANASAGEKVEDK